MSRAVALGDIVLTMMTDYFYSIPQTHHPAAIDKLEHQMCINLHLRVLNLVLFE